MKVWVINKISADWADKFIYCNTIAVLTNETVAYKRAAEELFKFNNELKHDTFQILKALYDTNKKDNFILMISLFNSSQSNYSFDVCESKIEGHPLQ